MKKNYDVIVIGGGPAGMLAAASAASQGVKVLLLEKNQSLGKKMLITGGGRCNLTNNADINEMVNNIPGNGKFVYSALHRFSGVDLRSLFSKLGVRTKVEARGRVFPVSDRAVDVVEALAKYLRQLAVHIQLGSSVSSLIIEEENCLGVKAGDAVFYARAVIVATGGVSYPQTGSSGEGHKIAREAGHSVTKLFPAAVSVTASDTWIVDRQLQGLSLPDVRLTLYNQKGKVLASEVGDVIITHWGLSGPGALRIGRAVALQKQKEPASSIRCELDIFPGKTKDYLEQELNELIITAGKRSIKNVLQTILPDRLARLTVFLLGYPQDASVIKLNKDNIIKEMAQLLKALPINITGTRPIEEATVTGGGVTVKEINPRTMASKLVKGLFFAGEVLDVDAQTGGFNMQVAFSTGYVAGEAAAALAREALD